MTDYPWLEVLNPPRRAAVFELACAGRLTPEIIAALRDEKWPHAAGLVLSAVTGHLHDAARLARQIETGAAQQ